MNVHSYDGFYMGAEDQTQVFPELKGGIRNA